MTWQGSLLVLLENNSGEGIGDLRSVVLLIVETVPIVSLKLYISYYTYLEELYINTKMHMDLVPYT